MTRQFFWIAAATVIGSSLLSYDTRALAQQEEAPAEAEADTGVDSSADADASADTSADENTSADANSANTETQADAPASSNDSTDAQAETQADAQGTTDASATSDASAGTGQENANAPLPQPSNSQQDTAGDPQAAPADNNQDQSTDQQRSAGRQQDGAAFPPPADTRDSSTSQPLEQSRLRNPQDQRDTVNRDRGDRSDRRHSDVDIRRGIEFGRASDRGLIVNNVEQNSFYYNSGIRRGDVVVSVHGRPVRNQDDFMQFVILQPGQRVPVVVLRDGRRETIHVQYRHVARRHPVPNEQYRAGGAYLGVVFDAQYPDAAVVLRTNPGSPAHEAGLQAGDILVALNGQEVVHYQDAISIVRGMRPGDQLEILFERARTEREALAMLDAQPGVRTANRPSDVRIGEQYTDDRSDDVRDDVNRSNDYDRSRDGRYEEGGRRLLPRFRN